MIETERKVPQAIIDESERILRDPYLMGAASYLNTGLYDEGVDAPLFDPEKFEKAQSWLAWVGYVHGVSPDAVCYAMSRHQAMLSTELL